MENNKAPCIECTDRHVNCHGDCGSYKAWKADLDQRNASIRKKKIKDADFHLFQSEQIRKELAKKRRLVMR